MQPNRKRKRSISPRRSPRRRSSSPETPPDGSELVEALCALRAKEISSVKRIKLHLFLNYLKDKGSGPIVKTQELIRVMKILRRELRHVSKRHSQLILTLPLDEDEPEHRSPTTTTILCYQILFQLIRLYGVDIIGLPFILDLCDNLLNVNTQEVECVLGLLHQAPDPWKIVIRKKVLMLLIESVDGRIGGPEVGGIIHFLLETAVLDNLLNDSQTLTVLIGSVANAGAVHFQETLFTWLVALGERDPKLRIQILEALIRFWPLNQAWKQWKFLETVRLLGPIKPTDLSPKMVGRLLEITTDCLGSEHGFVQAQGLVFLASGVMDSTLKEVHWKKLEGIIATLAVFGSMNWRLDFVETILARIVDIRDDNLAPLISNRPRRDGSLETWRWICANFGDKRVPVFRSRTMPRPAKLWLTEFLQAESDDDS